jgi:hypothetical protein
MNINGYGANVLPTKEASNSDNKIAEKKTPISMVAMGFSKSVGDDKRLSDLSQKLDTIDEKTIRDFASHLNGVGNGAIISDAIIEKAIKGLKYEGNELPELSENNPDLAKLDAQIKNATQKMLTLNSASLIVNPNSILNNIDDDMSILPIPVLTVQEEKIGDIFKDEKAFAQSVKLSLPKDAQGIFDKNYPILRETNLDDAKSLNTDAIGSASKEDNAKINADIVDNITEVYQMVTLRFLAQLGNAPSGVPSSVPSVPAAKV